MFLLARSLRELSFSSLMNVYAQTNRETGQHRWPEESPDRQLALAEGEFLDYLMDVFFQTEGAVYAVRTEGNRYVSALRLEPYRDGLLLESLETAPEERGRGYASDLISFVQAELKSRGKAVVYSHVGKQNAPSLAVHEKCGFRILSDCAAYLDGSVNRRAYTLVWQGER